MNDAGDVVIVLLILAMGMVGGIFIGNDLKEKSIRAEAIKAGAAEYVITNKETGATEFRWKESAK